MKILNFSVNLDKIDKSKIIKGKKGKYLPLTAFIADEEDQFGNTVSVIETQSEDERKEKADRNYVANGKVVYDSDNSEGTSEGLTEEEEDSLPF